MLYSLIQKLNPSLIGDVASEVVPQEKNKNAPAYNVEIELAAAREGRLDSYGLEMNLVTALSETYRLALGIPYEMAIDENGFLVAKGAREPLVVMYAPERQVTEVDKIRAPYDLNGVVTLQCALKEVQKNKRPPFSWTMISPSIGIGSGFVMIEIGRTVGFGSNATLVARRLVVPVKQFKGNSELSVLKKLGEKLSGDLRYRNLKNPLEILGEINFHGEDEDLLYLVDSYLEEILGSKVVYGVGNKTIEESQRQFQEIISILKNSGAIPDFLSFLAYHASLPIVDRPKVIRELRIKRNILFNKFLDLKEKFDEKGFLTAEERESILKNSNEILTRDASGFCSGSEGRDTELEAMIRKVGYDSKGPRAFRCPGCKSILVRRKENTLIKYCYLCSCPIPKC